MIEFHNVTKRYPGGFDALSNVSMHLEAGDMAFLTGHSGAGKSTLLKIISLIEKPTRGQALLNRINLSHNRSISRIDSRDDGSVVNT